MKAQLVFAALLWSAGAHATEWQVSAITGSDAHDGRTPATAFQTLQKAETVVKPGDVVVVGDGIYSNTDRRDGGAVLDIASTGTPDAWITWKARPGSHPTVHANGWAGIQIRGSYQVIDGFQVIGNNDAIVLLRAQEDAKKVQPDPYFNTNGIVIQGRRNAPDRKPHHIVIRNCVVGKNSGGGITALEADYVTVEDNLVYENAWFMRYGGSGITFLGNWAHDDKPGYHIVVQRNRVWNNKTLVAWEKIGKLSDGNGILLDVSDPEDIYGGATNPDADAAMQAAAASAAAAEAAKPRRPPWNGRQLVANNLSAFNGGSGIHTFRTAHVDIINNTTYWNGQTVGYPELFANRSDDVVVLNNVIVPRPGGAVTSNSRNSRLRWDFNLYPSTQGILKGANDIVSDPRFIDIQTDLTRADFRLGPGSRGLDSGTDDMPQATDLVDTPRPQGKARDRGAFEQ